MWTYIVYVNIDDYDFNLSLCSFSFLISTSLLLEEGSACVNVIKLLILHFLRPV